MALSERLFAAGLEQLSGSVGQIRADAKGRLDHLEQRLADAENTARFNTDVLDHALEKIEASANQRARDQVENQRRAAQTEQRCNRLEDSFARLEMCLPDARRLGAVEKALGDVVELLARHDPVTHFGASVEQQSRRLEALEKDNRNLLEEVRGLLRPAVEPLAFTQPLVVEAPPVIEPPADCFGATSEALADPVEYSTPAAPDFDDIFVEAPYEPENFLARARRSVRPAPGTPRPYYLFPVLVVFLVVLALAAGLALNARTKDLASVPPAGGLEMRTFSLPEPPDNGGGDTQFVVAPSAEEPLHVDAPPRTAMPLQQRDVPSAPVNPVPVGDPNTSVSVPLDRVIQMANSGNPDAQAFLGLRSLDGTNGAAVNLPDAIKFLTQAAEKGQAVAQYRLGTLYERGQGVPADAAKAAHWYEMAANRGNRKATHNLAVFYSGGAAGKKNMAEAARWFAKAAALGLSDSQFNLAVLYERGDGVPQSLLDAYKWYSIAAAAGDSESKARIDVLQTQLSDADKAAANKSAATFHAAPLNHAANVPPDTSSLGL